MPDAEIIIGGPPCTNFSAAKSNKTRNILSGLSLVQAFLRCVYLKQPKYWIMENVPTIQKYLPSSIPLEWIGIDSEGELEIPVKKELIASDFGVPQKRKRYLIGNFPLPKETHIDPKEITLFSDNTLPKWKTMGEVLKDIPNRINKNDNSRYQDPNYNLSLAAQDITDQFYDSSLSISESRSIENAKTNHPYMGLLSFPDKLNEPARTVVATQLGRETLVLDNYKNKTSKYRRATVRECAILQSFPITYQFFGNTYGIKYRLVGDAVPPLLSFAIAKEIANKYGKPITYPLMKDYIREKSNKLDDVYEKKRKRINPKRNISIMLPSKEVRGARAEIYNSGFKEDEFMYNEINFKIPIWNSRIVLGEGSKNTRIFPIDKDKYLHIEKTILDDKRFRKNALILMKEINSLIENLPENKILYGKFLSNVEENPIQLIMDDVKVLVDKYFKKISFHDEYIDLTNVINHHKANKFRLRIGLGSLIAYKIAKALNLD